MKKILIIEDDPAYRVFVIQALKAERFDIRGVEDGVAALSLIRRGDFKPDLLIVDYQLGEMNGFNLMRDIRALDATRATPALMLTGTGKDIEGLMRAEGVAFLKKGVTAAEILSNVRKLLGVDSSVG